jgi:hypothetical protein
VVAVTCVLAHLGSKWAVQQYSQWVRYGAQHDGNERRSNKKKTRRKVGRPLAAGSVRTTNQNACVSSDARPTRRPAEWEGESDRFTSQAHVPFHADIRISHPIHPHMHIVTLHTSHGVCIYTDIPMYKYTKDYYKI